MTEMDLRNLFVSTLRSYEGSGHGNDLHRKLLDYYNSNPNLPRGHKMTVNNPWCAATPSAVAIQLGMEDIVFPECSCSLMIELYKAAGRWVERDDYVPQIGDLIIYDWDDSGRGDNTGDPEHVGTVEAVEGGIMWIREGNMDNAMGVRVLHVNDRFIRGYCCPNYAAKAGKEDLDMSKFRDVKDGAWYADKVDKAAELGLMVGISEDEFGVGQPVTREQLATVAVKLHELLSK